MACQNGPVSATNARHSGPKSSQNWALQVALLGLHRQRIGPILALMESQLYLFLLHEMEKK